MSTPNHFKNARIVATGVTPEVYQRNDSERGKPDYTMSRSELCEFVTCPSRWRRGFVRPESKAMSNGSLIDVLALSPRQFSERFVECPATYTATGMKCPSCGSITDSKSCRACKCEREPIKIEKPWDWGATYCKEFREAHDGLEPVRSEDFAEAKLAVKTLIDDPIVAEILSTSQTQVLVMAEYHDPRTGLVIPFKALMDLVPPASGRFGNSLLDLKTTRSAAYSFWRKDVFIHNYHTQGALYLALYNAATGEKRDTFRHICQENVPPYHVELRELTPEFLDIGRQAYVSALEYYCACLAKNEWPGYYARTVVDSWQMVDPEPWMLSVDQTMFRAIEMQEPVADPAWLKEAIL